MSFVIHNCPDPDCKTNGRRTRMIALGDRDPDTGNWRTFTDPVDGVQIFRCPHHGRFYLRPGETEPQKVAA